MTERAYRNYIFDLYGTLADIHTDEEKPDLWERFSLFLHEKGIGCGPDPVRPDQLKAAYRTACRKQEQEAEERLRLAGIPGPAEIDILEVWQSIIAGCGKRQEDFSKEDLLEFSRVFRSLSMVKLRLFPGAKELLERLRQAGKRVVLLSNAQASFTMPELEQLGLTESFDRIFISSDVGVKKPSPAFYGLPEKNGFLPAESVMIGNDDVCDCHGAAAVGMDSLYIRTEQSPAPSGPLPENCREIPDLFFKFL